MRASAHRIRRLSLACPSPTEQDAFALRQALTAQWQPRLLPVFEAAFDRLCPDGRTLHIPRLELQLDLSGDAADIDALSEQLEMQLQQWLQGQEVAATERQVVTVQQGAVAIVLHYLAHGNLPWQAVDETASDIAGTLAGICRDYSAPIIAQLKAQSLDRARLYRLFQLLDAATAERYVTGLLAGVAQAGYEQIARVVCALYQAGAVQSSPSQCLPAIAAIVHQATQPTEAPVPVMLAQTLQQAGLLEVLDASLRDELTAALNAYVDVVAYAPDALSPAAQSATAPSRDVTPPGQPAAVNASSPGAEALQPAEPRQVHQRAQAAGQEQLYPLKIDNAGLVLLHPFIAPLFKATGICNEPGKEISAYKLPEAAALLHYLASGHDDIYEFNTALIKPLLGLSPQDPLLVGPGQLGEAQKREADALLQAVIGHWPALKNTSVGGLRASFLQRDGLLKSLDAGWQLQVEARPYDVLLDQCPWGHTVVRLPWMKQAIYTQWR